MPVCISHSLGFSESPAVRTRPGQGWATLQIPEQKGGFSVTAMDPCQGQTCTEVGKESTEMVSCQLLELKYH